MAVTFNNRACTANDATEGPAMVVATQQRYARRARSRACAEGAPALVFCVGYIINPQACRADPTPAGFREKQELRASTERLVWSL